MLPPNLRSSPSIESSDDGKVVVTATDMVVECGTPISLKQLSADVAEVPAMMEELSSKVKQYPLLHICTCRVHSYCLLPTFPTHSPKIDTA